MGRCIVKIRDRYFEWSSVVDAPVTYGMTEPELRDYIKERYGSEGLDELGTRLARVEKFGTSSIYNVTLKQLLAHNRAGDKDERLTEEEIWQRYANR